MFKLDLGKIIDQLKSDPELRERFIMVRLNCFETLNKLNKYINNKLRLVRNIHLP